MGRGGHHGRGRHSRCASTSTREGVEFVPGGRPLGKGPHGTVEAELLPDSTSARPCSSIGVAGENLVRIASVMHEQAHALGRGGMGAVFGSKRLKAVSVTSPGPLKTEAQEQFAPTRREISKLAVGLPHWRPTTTASAPRSMVGLLNETGTFPTDFFTKGAAPHRATLEAEHWPEWAKHRERHLSALPPALPASASPSPRAPRPGASCTGRNTRPSTSFGGSCMVEHARDVAKLNERCNLLGIDTISGGNLAAIAIKAQATGADRRQDPTPGDVEAIDRLLIDIAHRSTPTGDALAEGMDDALDESRHERVVDHQQGHGPGRLRASAAQGHGPQLRRQRPRRLPPARHLLQAGAGRDARGLGRRRLRRDLHRLGRPHAPSSTASPMCRFYRDFLTWERDRGHRHPAERGSGDQGATRRRWLDETITRIRGLNFAFGATPADDTVAERFFREATDRAPALDRERAGDVGSGSTGYDAAGLKTERARPEALISATGAGARDLFGDGLAHVLRARRAAQVVGDPLALADHRAHGREESVGGLCLAQVAEHEHGRTG